MRPSVKGREDVSVGKSQVNGTRSVGPCEGKLGVDAWSIEEGQA